MATVTIKHNNDRFQIDFKQALNKYGRSWANHVTMQEVVDICSKRVDGKPVKILCSGGKPYSFSKDNGSFSASSSSSSSSSSAQQLGNHRDYNYNNNNNVDDDDDGGGGFVGSFINWVNSSLSFINEQKEERGSFVVCKDMSASLSNYGIKNGSKLLMYITDDTVQSPPRKQQKQDTQPPLKDRVLREKEKPKEEAATAVVDPVVKALTTLDDIHNSAKQVEPKVDEYLSTIPDTPKKAKETPVFLSETLMQQLLRIDAMPLVEDDGVRTRRRAVVKYLNMLLEKIDDRKSQLKAKE